MVTVFVALAAGVGAVARYLVDPVVSTRTGGEFPYGTLLVNVTGSFLLGLVTGLAVHPGHATTPTLVLGVGFAGGYTTLSTWTWESLTLAETGEIIAASINILGSVAVGL